jgi:hypothetical protein
MGFGQLPRNIDEGARSKVKQQKPAVLWFTDLSGRRLAAYQLQCELITRHSLVLSRPFGHHRFTPLRDLAGKTRRESAKLARLARKSPLGFFQFPFQ